MFLNVSFGAGEGVSFCFAYCVKEQGITLVMKGDCSCCLCAERKVAKRKGQVKKMSARGALESDVRGRGTHGGSAC